MVEELLGISFKTVSQKAEEAWDRGVRGQLQPDDPSTQEYLYLFERFLEQNSVNSRSIGINWREWNLGIIKVDSKNGGPSVRAWIYHKGTIIGLPFEKNILI